MSDRANTHTQADVLIISLMDLTQHDCSDIFREFVLPPAHSFLFFSLYHLLLLGTDMGFLRPVQILVTFFFTDMAANRVHFGAGIKIDILCGFFTDMTMQSYSEVCFLKQIT